MEIDQREELLVDLLILLAVHLEVLAIHQVAKGPPATSKTRSCYSSELRSWHIGC